MRRGWVGVMETKMSTVEFAEKYFGMKFFDYQKRILNSLDKNRDENILVWMPSRDNRKSLYSYYLMQKVNVKYKQISLCAFIGSLFGYLSIFCLLYTIYHFELKAPAPKEPIVKVITMKTSHSE